MANEMTVVAYFRARHNDKAPLFVARFEYDAEAMRKHPEFFECDKDGKGLKGEVSLPKHSVPAAVEPTAEPAVTAKPPPLKKK